MCGGGNDHGNVNIFVFEVTLWKQYLSSIKGDIDEQFVWSKSISTDGLTVAIGAPYSNVTGLHKAQVSVYSYDDIESEWSLKREVISGSDGSLFGWYLKLKCSVDEYTPRSSSAMGIVCIQLMTVTIQCGGVDTASSLFMHWCRLWLGCMVVPGRWHHHIGKVTWIILKSLIPWVYPKVEISDDHHEYSFDDGDDPMWRCECSQ